MIKGRFPSANIGRSAAPKAQGFRVLVKGMTRCFSERAAIGGYSIAWPRLEPVPRRRIRFPVFTAGSMSQNERMPKARL
jgi:hypothetical protein